MMDEEVVYYRILTAEDFMKAEEMAREIMRQEIVYREKKRKRVSLPPGFYSSSFERERKRICVD